jgi:hypothetical protein
MNYFYCSGYDNFTAVDKMTFVNANVTEGAKCLKTVMTSVFVSQVFVEHSKVCVCE